MLVIFADEQMSPLLSGFLVETISLCSVVPVFLFKRKYVPNTGWTGSFVDASLISP